MNKQMKHTLYEATASIVGKGIIAGATGIAGMLLSQQIGKRVFGKTPNRAPAEVAGKLLGLKPTNEASKARFNKVIEIAYGSVWGIFRAWLGSKGTRGPAASALHLASIGASISTVIPALGWVPPPRKWSKEKLSIEIVHHTVYVLVTGWAYDMLND